MALANIGFLPVLSLGPYMKPPTNMLRKPWWVLFDLMNRWDQGGTTYDPAIARAIHIYWASNRLKESYTRIKNRATQRPTCNSKMLRSETMVLQITCEWLPLYVVRYVHKSTSLASLYIIIRMSCCLVESLSCKASELIMVIRIPASRRARQ